MTTQRSILSDVFSVFGSEGNIDRSLQATQKLKTHYLSSPQENTHRLTLSMSPDEAYVEKQVKAEEEKLQRKVRCLSDADRKEIYRKGGTDSMSLKFRAPKGRTCNGFEQCDVVS